MKYNMILLVLFVISCVWGEIVFSTEGSLEEVVLIESTDNSKLIEFNLSMLEAIEVYLEEYGHGTVFRMPANGGLLAEIGSPDLPAIRRMVLIPSTGDVELEIVSSESQYLGCYNVAPYQEPPTYSGGPAPYTINSRIYSASRSFPSSPAVIESVNILRDIRIAWIRFNPVTVNPVTGDVSIITSMRVRVEGIGGTGENELVREAYGYTRSFLRFYREVIGMGSLMDMDVVDGSYVFIGTEESVGLAQEIISWKRQKGYNVEIGLLPEIGSTVSEIDAWLENAFLTWPNPPEYVMLLGDTLVVPTPMYECHAADNEYAVIGTGTALPSMNIGRICGNDIEDISYISWKIMLHEADPYQPAGENWFMRGFSMACNSSQAPQAPEEAQRMQQLFVSHGIDTDLYCDSLGEPPDLLQVISDINEGRSVICYIGHGSPYEWETTGFNIFDIAGLANGRRQPWVYTIGCMNGMFNYFYCFCEAFLSEGTIADPRGAITIMGSTTDTPFGPGDTLLLHTFRGYFTEELHHLGTAHTWGKFKCYEYFGSSGDNMIMMAALFGCPETDIYVDNSPIPVLSNSHASTIGTGTFQVTVTDNREVPVEGALVAAYYADTDELLDSDYTSAFGTALLYINSIPGPLMITITSTAHNRYPAITYASPEVGVGDSPMVALTGFYLDIPEPNPLVSLSSIGFGIPSSGEVELTVYDLYGRIVTSLGPVELLEGSHTFTWDGTSADAQQVPNGVYFIKLDCSSSGSISRLILVAR